MPFVTQYNPSVPNLKFFLHVMSKWHLMENQSLLRGIYREPTFISDRKGTCISLKDILVRAKLLTGLHTPNLSLQTRDGKLKLVCVNGAKTVGKHVGKLLTTNRTCLPTVFVPFTHTNLSLPTQICQLKFAV